MSNSFQNFFRRLAIFVFGFGLWASPVFGEIDLKAPPSDFVYDPSRILSFNERSEVSNILEFERRQRKFEIYYLIFNEEPEGGAELCAEKVGESWTEGDYWGVFYQIGARGQQDAVFGGDFIENGEISATRIKNLKDSAVSLASKEQKPAERVLKLIELIANPFGKIRVEHYDAYQNQLAKKRAVVQQKEEKKRSGLRSLIFLGIVALLLFLAGLFLFWKFRSRFETVIFPKTRPQTRLAAPYSGGGDANVTYE